jgi:hypothetical protein
MMSRFERYNRTSALENEWSLRDLAAVGVYPSGFGDVDAFRQAQAALGVKADGLFGPLSVAALARALTPEPSLHVPPDSPAARIVIAHEKGWGRSRLGKAPGGVTCLGLHHSVTRTVAGMMRALKGRSLSTNYSIDPLGTIREHAPPELMTAHAGAWNRCMVGIDIINPCEPRLWRKDEAWAAPVPTGGNWGARYGVLMRRSVIPDTPAALDSWRWLAGHLCARFGLGEYGPGSAPPPGVRLSSSELNPRAAAQRWAVLPHGAIDRNRWDGWAALM